MLRSFWRDPSEDPSQKLTTVAKPAVSALLGHVDEIREVVRVVVYVNSSTGFTEHAQVANGASDVLLEIFGDAGRHVRSAVGVAALPLNAAVEVELVVGV